MKFVDVEGGRLAYERAGAGPPLLFLHGLGIDRGVWAEVALRLEPRFDTIRLDLRGHGESSPADTPHAHHEDVACALSGLGVARAHVAGLSLGGAVALDLALAHPERVARLVLVSAALSGHAWSAEWIAAFRAVRAVGKAEGPVAARNAWAAHPLFATAPRAALDEMIARDSGLRWTSRELARELEPAANARLGDVRAETLVVTGERDLPDFRAIARTLAAGIPGARRVEFPDVGHLVPLEAPDLLADTMGSFLPAAPA